MDSRSGGEPHGCSSPAPGRRSSSAPGGRSISPGGRRSRDAVLRRLSTVEASDMSDVSAVRSRRRFDAFWAEGEKGFASFEAPRQHSAWSQDDAILIQISNLNISTGARLSQSSFRLGGCVKQNSLLQQGGFNQWPLLRHAYLRRTICLFCVCSTAAASP